MRVRTRYLITLLPLTLVPLFLIAGLAYFRIVDSYRRAEEDRVVLGIKQSRDQVERVILDKISALAFVAKDPVLIAAAGASGTDGADTQPREKLKILLESEPYIHEAFLLNTKGEVIEEVLRDSVDGLDRSHLRRFFDRAISYSVSQSEVISENHGGPRFLLSSRVFGKEGLAGFVVAVFDVRILYPALTPLSRNGTTTIVSDGRFPPFLDVLTGKIRLSDLQGLNLEAYLSSAKNPTSHGLRIANEDYSITFTPFWTIESTERIGVRPIDKWKLAVIEPYRSPPGLIQFQVVFWVLIFGMSAIVVWLAVFASRQITRPISRVSKAANLIARGKPYGELPEAGDFEVAELARSVKRLKTDIEAHQRSLIESARLSAMGEMTSEISHEMQNKISGLSLWLQHLDSEIDDDDERKEYVDEMKLSLDEFLEMLRSLKDYYRKPVLNLAEVDLAVLARETIDEHAEAASNKNIVLTQSFSGPAFFECDREKLKGVIGNIFLNAIEASPDGGRIDIALERTDAETVISIADSGNGIALEEREKVFYPFFTTKSSGSGLGLAISRNTVVAHGGSIVVGESNSGGALVMVRLPNGV